MPDWIIAFEYSLPIPIERLFKISIYAFCPSLVEFANPRVYLPHAFVRKRFPYEEQPWVVTVCRSFPCFVPKRLEGVAFLRHPFLRGSHPTKIQTPLLTLQ